MKWKNLILPAGFLAVSVAVLFGISALLAPVEAENKAKDRLEVMGLLLPGSQTFEEEAYEGEDSNISRVYRSESGCVMETIVNGYVDEITLLVGVDNSGKVTGVLVEDMNETWGLGRRAMTDQDFLSQLIGTDGEAAVGEDVDALTGATVTSKAVVKAVNSAAAYMTGADVSSSATEWGG